MNMAKSNRGLRSVFGTPPGPLNVLWERSSEQQPLFALLLVVGSSSLLSLCPHSHCKRHLLCASHACPLGTCGASPPPPAAGILRDSPHPCSHPCPLPFLKGQGKFGSGDLSDFLAVPLLCLTPFPHSLEPQILQLPSTSPAAIYM